MEEQALCRKIAHGSQRALEEAIRRYSAYVVTVIHNRSRGCLSPEDEEELEPGAVRICSGTGVVRLDEDGLALNGDTVSLEGDITVNGQGLESYIRSIVYDVLASMMG